MEKLKETANVSLAADLVGINRIRAYQLKKKDKEFSDLWDEAIEIDTDNLEYKARQRAMDGVKRPVFYMGCLNQTKNLNADTLLWDVL